MPEVTLSMPLVQATMVGMRHLGEMVRRGRERRGLLAKELADLLGRDASYVSRIETGRMKELPPPDVLDAFAKHLGLSVAEQLEAAGYKLGVSPQRNDDKDPTHHVREVAARYDWTEEDAIHVADYIEWYKGRGDKR